MRVSVNTMIWSPICRTSARNHFNKMLPFKSAEVEMKCHSKTQCLDAKSYTISSYAFLEDDSKAKACFFFLLSRLC